jgi:hypothetical protein
MGNQNFEQGDQIVQMYTGLPDFSWHEIPKRRKIATKLPKIYHTAVIYSKQQ